MNHRQSEVPTKPIYVIRVAGLPHFHTYPTPDSNTNTPHYKLDVRGGNKLHTQRQRDEATKKGAMRRTYIEHDNGGVMRQVQEPRCGHREDHKT
jgi:hypothetical protein